MINAAHFESLNPGIRKHEDSDGYVPMPGDKFEDFRWDNCSDDDADWMKENWEEYVAEAAKDWAIIEQKIKEREIG